MGGHFSVMIPYISVGRVGNLYLRKNGFHIACRGVLNFRELRWRNWFLWDNMSFLIYGSEIQEFPYSFL